MLNPDTLTFQEFVMAEPVPLSTIHGAILDFLIGREDAAVFGDQAVNAYVSEPRMTQDVDLLSPRAKELAEELCAALKTRFHLAVCIREVGEGRGYRLFQISKDGNRHLADIRPVGKLPATQRMQGVLVIAPVGLIAYKVIAYHRRRGQPKAGTDWRDIALLLLAFPILKQESGAVADCLLAAEAEPGVMAEWKNFVGQDIQLPDDDDEF